jgi:hypothetical protein
MKKMPAPISPARTLPMMVSMKGSLQGAD